MSSAHTKAVAVGISVLQGGEDVKRFPKKNADPELPGRRPQQQLPHRRGEIIGGDDIRSPSYRLFVVGAAGCQDRVTLIDSVGHRHLPVAREELVAAVMDLAEVKVAAGLHQPHA